jgi:hypothetical protein
MSMLQDANTTSSTDEVSLLQQFSDAVDDAGLCSVNESDKLKDTGDLLFTEQEAAATSDLLVSVFRKLCVQEHVTLPYFNEKYKQYAILVLGKTPQSAANNRTNILKMLKRGDKLSWKKFLELTQLVLGFRPDKVIIEFSKIDNEKIQISTKPSDV